MSNFPQILKDEIRAALDRGEQEPIDVVVTRLRQIVATLAESPQFYVAHGEQFPAWFLHDQADVTTLAAISTPPTVQDGFFEWEDLLPTEHFSDSPRYDERSLVYIAGMLGYKFLSGNTLVPFGGESVAAVMNQRLKLGAKNIAEIRRDIPKEVSVAIMKALAPDPADRFQSLSELQKSLVSANVGV